MATKAKSAYGTKIKIGDGLTPETFTEIPEVGDIDGPGIEQEHEELILDERPPLRRQSGIYPHAPEQHRLRVRDELRPHGADPHRPTPGRAEPHEEKLSEGES